MEITKTKLREEVKPDSQTFKRRETRWLDQVEMSRFKPAFKYLQLFSLTTYTLLHYLQL